ncbi:hypothetical protein BJ138DRAFT_1149415 [Hygrophoropsis aurantiaca]|uniref:Uncharacterized protein n=1 Tax=Hygrophoropsis aurantiaca TaxID=72124 RepID=A0ACB8AH05_9AGAM|nr:hypothetical protein BJ138DRAFT_1149415 [Hygrophoropsis aurantiaca]
MIRRTPTMIPMSDADVQDIRTLVAQQKQAYETKQKALFNLKKVAERPHHEDDLQSLMVIKQLEAHREREEKHKRLGIPPAQSGSGSSSK